VQAGIYKFSENSNAVIACVPLNIAPNQKEITLLHVVFRARYQALLKHLEGLLVGTEHRKKMTNFIWANGENYL
jgi:hypothetical protein